MDENRLWNKLDSIEDEVKNNTKEIAVVKERLDNHLTHQDKKTNIKLTVFAIIIGAGVGLLAIFI